MNMQQIMQQAQKMQRDIQKSKEEINGMIFESKSNWVSVEMDGNKMLKKATISLPDNFEKEDVEALEDMVKLAVNDCIKKIEQETESRLGKYGSALNGLM